MGNSWNTGIGDCTHVQLVEWLASNLIGPLYNRLCVLILCACTEPVGFKLLCILIVFVYLGSYRREN